MKRNTVLILSENFFPLTSASAQRLFAYAETFVSHSHETFVMTKSTLSYKSKKLTVIGLNPKKEFPIFDPILLFLYLMKSISIIRKHHIDLIISTVPKINNAVAGLFLSKLFGTRHIIDIRDYWEVSFLLYPLNRVCPRPLAFLFAKITSLIYRDASSLITLNRTLKKILIRSGVPRDRIYIIPNGANTSLFRPTDNEKSKKELRKKYALPTSKLIFIYGGALTQENKLDVVLEGISHLRENREFTLLIVGKPTMLMTKERLLQIVDKLRLFRNVKILDPLPVDKYAELLRCCDVGVVPIDDNDLLKHVMTSKIFTYLASGLPVLVSGPKEGELQKLTSKYKIGFFTGETTPKAFAEGIKKFLEQRAKIKNMGLMGRQVVERNYDRVILSQRILQLIHA